MHGHVPVGRVLEFLRSAPVRVIFIVAAVTFALWVVSTQWNEIGPALSLFSPGALLWAFTASLAFGVFSMLAWRELLADVGTRLSASQASRVFFVSQVGKYLPGGVWNILAAAEMGIDHRIPRRRSVAGMAVWMLVSVVTALLVAMVALVFGPESVRASYGWVAFLAPALAALLIPQVLNPLVELGLKMLRATPLEHPISGRSIGISGAWSVVSWVVAGLQVWILATAAGLERSTETMALTTGGYSLAWSIGFLAIPVPTGIGIREAVLGLVLGGHIGGGAVVVTVLLARVTVTVADLILGMGAASLIRRRVG